MLIKQQTRSGHWPGTSGEVHYEVLSASKLPSQVLHSRHVLMLRPPHRPLFTASCVFVPVQGLFPWPSRDVRHQISSSRVLRPIYFSGVVANHLQHRILHCFFSPEINLRLRSRRGEEMSSTRVTIENPTAPGRQKRLVFYLKHLRNRLFLSLQILLHTLYFLLRRMEAPLLMIKHQVRTE